MPTVRIDIESTPFWYDNLRTVNSRLTTIEHRTYEQNIYFKLRFLERRKKVGCFAWTRKRKAWKSNLFIRREELICQEEKQKDWRSRSLKLALGRKDARNVQLD